MDHERLVAAQEETREILESLAGISLPRNNGEPNAALLQWVENYLRGRVAAGKHSALTPLLRLPDIRWAPLAAILKGDAPYSSMSPRLSVVVRNVSHGPVSIEHGYKWTPQPVQVAAGWVDGETGFGTGLKKLIAKGDTCELQTHFAVSQLRKYQIEAWATTMWELGSMPDQNYIEEVGFCFDLDGQRFRHVPSEHEKKGREKVA